jgi:hypothetical protein
MRGRAAGVKKSAKFLFFFCVKSILTWFLHMFLKKQPYTIDFWGSFFALGGTPAFVCRLTSQTCGNAYSLVVTLAQKKYKKPVPRDHGSQWTDFFLGVVKSVTGKRTATQKFFF